MDYCNECNKPLDEETPYCEECMNKQIEEQEVQWSEYQNHLNECGAEIEARYKEYQTTLELINDDKLVSNRYEYMRMLPEVIAARDAYIKTVIKHFDESCLDDHCRAIYEANKEFYQPQYMKRGLNVGAWGKTTWNDKENKFEKYNTGWTGSWVKS